MNADLGGLLPPGAPRWRREIARSLDARAPCLHSRAALGSWLTVLRATVELTARPGPLAGLDGWVRDGGTLRHASGSFFGLMGVEAAIGNREVARWCQPLMFKAAPGDVAFLVKPVRGVWHLLAQARAEPGCSELLEIGPTVQTTTPMPWEDGESAPFADALRPGAGVVHYDVMQSDEGGRFHQEQNRHRLVEMPADFAPEPPPRFRWMTFGQLRRFVADGHAVNIEARSLLACLLPF